MLCAHLFRSIIKTGELTIIDAAGRQHRFGDPAAGPCITIRLHDRNLHTKLILRPELYFGEAYMDGTMTIEEGADARDLLQLVGRNMEQMDSHWSIRLMQGLSFLTRPLQQMNRIGKAREHVAHHYDLSDKLYELFLDSDRQYSCAYFASENDNLETAQANKKRHIASKLRLEKGGKVLDIGSGWGGLALYLARVADCDVTGLTLSEEQHKYANARAEAEGLGDRVRFLLSDYREHQGDYDRIVSVGMFEHVGARFYDDYFKQVTRLLKPDGVALLHSIGRMEQPGSTNPWLRKYIFPGGYSPALSETLGAIERQGLWVTDIEILREHYAHTLKAWWDRFQENRDTVRELYDERFCRMWEFYLAACEASFYYWRQMVFQIQLTQKLDTTPITRDYMREWEVSNA